MTAATCADCGKPLSSPRYTRCKRHAQQRERNGNWKGGIATDHYRYKKLQVERYPERVAARQRLHDWVRSGKVKRGACVVCGRTEVDGVRIQAHHWDYERDVYDWVCAGKCHRLLDRVKRMMDVIELEISEYQEEL